MKKILSSLFVLSLVFALPLTASAATFSFIPSAGSFKPEQKFTILVYVNPASGEQITTAKLSASFPSNLVKVTNFSQASGWMALTQPAVGASDDNIDNTKGLLVKTGGYPARVTTSKLFGTITFRAKADGAVKVGVNSNSILLNPTNVNKFVASNGANFTIATPVVKKVVKKKKAVVKTKTKTKIEKTEPKEVPAVASSTTQGSTTEEVATTTGESATNTNSQVAAAAAANTNSGSKAIWYYLLAFTVLIIGGISAWKRWGNKLQEKKNLMK